jgi:hypothetical protein
MDAIVQQHLVRLLHPLAYVSVLRLERVTAFRRRAGMKIDNRIMQIKMSECVHHPPAVIHTRCVEKSCSLLLL